MAFKITPLLISHIYISILAIKLIFCNSSPHDYCSKIENFDQTRKIPVRNGKNMEDNLTLTQIQVIIRHGERTPSGTPGNSCFPKMREDPIRWNCSYFESFSGQHDDYETIIFDQKYDAKVEENVLLGTCKVGQLMSYGADQQSKLGDILYDNYFSGSNSLFDLNSLNNNPDLFYFRSTDFQRTLHSGASLISKLFKNMELNSDQVLEVPPTIHIADFNTDSMRGDIGIACPEFRAIESSLFSSSEYISHRRDTKSTFDKIASLQEQELDFYWFWETIDCYGSLVCNNLQDYLPDELKDEGNLPSTFANETYKLIESDSSFISTWKNSSISKCMIRPFVQDFMKGFKIHQEENDFSFLPSKSKFNLYSAHDSTIMFFLSAIDNLYDGIWPSYASMVIFELYEDESNNFYFRALYNGKDITDGISGCSESDYFKKENVCPYLFLVQAANRSQEIQEFQKSTFINRSTLYFILIGLAGLLVGIVLASIVNCINRRKRSNNKSKIAIV